MLAEARRDGSITRRWMPSSSRPFAALKPEQLTVQAHVRTHSVQMRTPSVLLDIAHLAGLERDLHVLVHVDLLRSQINHALGRSQGCGYFVDRLSL